MLAKTVQEGGLDWDHHLPYVLFAYRASQQDSTLESPFFLLYGRDPRLPTSATLCPTKMQANLNLQEYGLDIASRMSLAWETARKSIKKAQKRQKQYYDWKTKPPQFRVGDRTFLLKPAECTGNARKLTRHYHGPYRVVEVTANNAKIRPVDVPRARADVLKNLEMNSGQSESQRKKNHSQKKQGHSRTNNVKPGEM